MKYFVLIHFSISGPRSFQGGGAGRPPTPSSLRSHKSSRSVSDEKLSRPRSNSNINSDPNINKHVTSVLAASRPRLDTQSPKVAPPQQASPSVSVATSIAHLAATSSPVVSAGKLFWRLLWSERVARATVHSCCF